jgi:formylglycine-generating enzyme required for sulfatase activity
MSLQKTIILAPSVTFRQIEQELAGEGWQHDPDFTTVDPREPELASWSQSYDEELDYFFDASTGLRTIHLRGEHAVFYAQELTKHLPTLTLDAIQTLLHANQTENVLQGIAAAKAMKAIPLMEPLARLCNHPNPNISESAMQAFKQCFPDLLQTGFATLKQAKAKHPERSVLFSHLSDASQRRQILRWLIRDYSETNDHILATLGSALTDLDWEVRATAILAVARLKAVSLINLVRKVELPQTSREGLDAVDRQLLLAFRKAAVAWLEGQQPPQQENNPSTSREAMRWHVLRCVAGLPVSWHDRVFLLAFSLTEPVPSCERSPSTLPTSIIEDQDGYRLAQTGLELVWIPPIQHWLGDDLEHPLISHPIHSVNPATGFFITKYPLTQSLIQKLDTSLATNKTPNNQTEYYTCSWQEAQQIRTDLSQKLGLAFTLPTPDEWEMAARGPDGRRFPWGNGLECNMLRSPSPWGCRDIVGIISQWTNNLSGSGEVIVCGGTNQLRCAMREIAATEQANVGLRLVLRS